MSLEGRGRAAILMYHRLSATVFDAGDGDYVLTPESFAQQMRLLAAEGRTVVSLPALLRGACPERSVVLTFDDGSDTDFTVALPLLRDAGFPAAFFVNPARLGREGYLSWGQLEQLVRAGMLVGSHGLDHRLLDGLGAAELAEQLGGSKRALERGLGTTIDALSLPGGSGGARAIRAADDAGYRVILGSQPGLVRPPSLPRVLPRYALRESHGLEEFGALVDQRLAVRAARALRYRTTRLARAAIGARRYERLRLGWLHQQGARAGGATGERKG